MIEKVISGGQIGADIAALRAAKRVGIETGGFMPLNYMTLEGPRPEYADQYGMWYTSQATYPPRTRFNVQNSDGTLRFATNWLSPGERCTFRYISQLDKPFYDVDPNSITDIESELMGVRSWIVKNDIKVLNVAGNAEKRMEPFVEYFMEKLLARRRYADPGD